MKFKHVTLGGTFDHFHRGHEAIIAKAYEVGETVWLGLTTDEFIKTSLSKVDKYSHLIESYSEREKILRRYLEKKGWISQTRLIPIDDRFGTTLSDQTISAIVVSPETESVAQEINELRKQKSWPELTIVNVPWILAADKNPIHSTRIRAGEISREGEVFLLPRSWVVKKMPEQLRNVLKQPLGELIKESSPDFEIAVDECIRKYLTIPRLVVTVGDAVTDSFLKKNYIPDISVIDLCIERKKVYETVSDLGFRGEKVLKVSNEPGTLSYQVYEALKTQLKHQQKPAVLQIDGEEDLITLFAVLVAPLYSLIIYGQPHEGIVVVEATESKKKEILGYLKLFS